MKPHVQKCRKNFQKNDVFGLGPNMCYINYNYPRTLPMNQYQIKKLIKDGNLESLEEKLLNGEGYKLIGHYSTNPKIKAFLQSVPIYLARMEMLQDSACKGNLRDMQVLLENGNTSRNVYKIPPEKLVCSKDLNGVTILHKVIYYDFLDIVEWLVKNYPQTVHIKDKTLRIPLHYICSCSEVSRVWDLLLEAGADPNSLDINNKTPTYYLEYSENITLPNNYKSDGSDQEVPIKASNIRIWIHERNIKQLSKVIWSGLGDKLLTETSKQTTVNKFLKAVPYIMGIIKEIHKAVIDDNLELLKKLNRDPVPIDVLASKDKNGLTPLHKAVGLGRLSIVDYIINKNPKTVNIRDNDGRTPLHYAYISPPKHIIPMYNRLVKAGANENVIDKNGKTPKNNGVKISDIPNDLLIILPKAPRIASEFPASWDWNIFYEPVEKTVKKLNSKNTLTQESKIQTNSTTSGTTKKNPTNIDYTGNAKITNYVEDIDNINIAKYNAEITNNVENINNTNDVDTTEIKYPKNNNSLNIQSEPLKIDNNIDNSENNDLKNRGNNFISLYSRSEFQDIDDVDNNEYQKNNNSDNDNGYENYISLYKKSEFQDIDGTKNIVSKPNSLTLGEVRQALNNGLLEDFLPINGRIYKDNSLNDTNKIEYTGNNLLKSTKNEERINSAQIIVKQGSLEQIADYILDGKYEKLVGITSKNPEIQDFLDKIPFYANKIDQIHRYCAVGDLDELIQLLDRKKFCLARESRSGLGLTPLHTAVIYEQFDVFGYLTDKFPETLKLIDLQGWTAIDYINCMQDKTFIDKLFTESNLEEFQADYQTAPTFGKCDVTFDPEKIRKTLGYVTYNTETVDKENIDANMDRSSSSSGKLLSVVMSASQFSAEDREYLIKAIGKPLSSGLKELIKRRPSNPTLYLAEHLTNHYDDPQLDQESGVLQPRVQTHGILNEDQPQVSENMFRPWDVFNNYQPEFKKISRDEFGMNMIHYAASRTHNRNAFFQLLQELDANIALRDEYYRTPRDIAMSSNIRENVKTIDKFVVHIIARGEHNKLIQLLLEGYNHILDLNTDKDIFALPLSRGHSHVSVILKSIPTFEEKRKRLHREIFSGAQGKVEEILKERNDECVMLAMAKNERSRCSLHIAVLSQNEEILRLIAENFPTTLFVLDNIERTALHYAMSVDQVEKMSTILIGNGANRIAKDLKGRQCSYYFMNKLDIRKMLEEEDQLRM
ncbi:uncharacterized protein LOC113548763 isoform X1 [Rhopalosiphum maidis]|uniref:uncharacterized protein LOC113548763 isoform X1 n=2 Tax=Rhopalosiphum maidis TaxID=43146 RepID=UPI000EFECE52|nr:uncharacterized protein LOC113548763 isoform X1 [Rhopalosiphum maidis]